MDYDDGGSASPFLEELLEEQANPELSQPDRAPEELMHTNTEDISTTTDEPMATESAKPSVSKLGVSRFIDDDEASNSSDDVPLAQIARSAEKLNEDQIKDRNSDTFSVDGANGSQTLSASAMDMLSPGSVFQPDASDAPPTFSSSATTQSAPAEKPLTAFAYFFNDRQKSIRSANPMATFEQVSNIVQAMWKNLDFTTRQEYFNKEQGVAGITVSASKKAAQTGSAAKKKEGGGPFVITPDPERPGVYNVALDPSSEQQLLKDGCDAQEEGETAAAPSIQPRMKTTSAAGRGRGRGRGRPPGSTNKTKKEAATRAVTEKKTAEKKTPARGRGRGRTKRVVSVEKVESPEVSPSPSPSPSPPPVILCIRSGCDKVPVINKKLGEDFCSSLCLVTYCSDEFRKWVESR